jgi:hypothetical protein
MKLTFAGVFAEDACGGNTTGGVKFLEKALSPEFFLIAAKATPSARKNRSEKQILASVRYNHTAYE